jgi:hypothetical protein
MILPPSPLAACRILRYAASFAKRDRKKSANEAGRVKVEMERNEGLVPERGFEPRTY